MYAKQNTHYAMDMTALLEQVLRRVQDLPDVDQDAIASQIIDLIEDEEQWERKFAATLPALQRLADEALAEHKRGETISLDDKS